MLHFNLHTRSVYYSLMGVFHVVSCVHHNRICIYLTEYTALKCRLNESVSFFTDIPMLCVCIYIYICMCVC